ncbi:MAG: aldolase/citrate lyase family protein [Fluviibacter sp.]
MLDFIQITNNPDVARLCDSMQHMRLFVDLERLGKAERQAGRNTFISQHALEDVGRIKSVLQRSRLMVRVNPLNEGSADEIDAVISQGADMIMLPMFESASTLMAFTELVGNRCPIVPLLETAGALESLEQWIDAPGLCEVYVGLNDLHLSMGMRFMFEPLAVGIVERVARAAKLRQLRFGFGGIARLDEGLLPGRAVLAEHLRLRSGAVILSRTFHREDSSAVFEQEVSALRAAEAELAARDPQAVARDARVTRETIQRIAAGMAPAAA